MAGDAAGSLDCAIAGGVGDGAGGGGGALACGELGVQAVEAEHWPVEQLAVRQPNPAEQQAASVRGMPSKLCRGLKVRRQRERPSSSSFSYSSAGLLARASIPWGLMVSVPKWEGHRWDLELRVTEAGCLVFLVKGVPSLQSVGGSRR